MSDDMTKFELEEKIYVQMESYYRGQADLARCQRELLVLNHQLDELAEQNLGDDSEAARTGLQLQKDAKVAEREQLELNVDEIERTLAQLFDELDALEGSSAVVVGVFMPSIDAPMAFGAGWLGVMWDGFSYPDYDDPSTENTFARTEQ